MPHKRGEGKRTSAICKQVSFPGKASIQHLSPKRALSLPTFQRCGRCHHHMGQAEITVAPHHPDLPRWPRRRLAVPLNLEVAEKWRPLQLLLPFSGQLQHGALSLQHLQLRVSTLRILLGNLSLVMGSTCHEFVVGSTCPGLPSADSAVSDSHDL